VPMAASDIEAMIRSALPDASVEITDLAGDGDHYAAKVVSAAFAGMPPVERCMGCHRFVLPENAGVAALRRYWNAGKAIPWVKVYTLPRFVHFNHEAHVLAHVECTRCHGDVADMNRVARVEPLTMGWCVGCHRETRAPDDCLTCHY